MENKIRVFRTLIEQLDDVLRRLQHIYDNNLWTESLTINDCFRMHLKMKNVIGTLVKKTINGKCPWEDIAQIIHTNGEFIGEPIFENHITSDEYIAESTKIRNATSGIKVLLSSLLSLQELLGDILDCSCQISNSPMKLSSGIFVHDLITVHQQYEMIWHFLNSLINPRLGNSPQIEEETRITKVNSNLLGSIQSSFKELTKIKLEIEHYFKVNTIELQFKHSDNMPTMSFYDYIPNADCPHLYDYITDDYKSNSNESSPAKSMSINITEKNTFDSCENVDLPSQLFTKSNRPQSDNSSDLFSSIEPSRNFNMQNACLNNAFLRSTLHFDPTVFINSKTRVLKHGQDSKMIGTDLMKQRLYTEDCASYINYQVIQDPLKENGAGRKQNKEKNEQCLNVNLGEHLTCDRIDKELLTTEVRDIESSKSQLEEDSVNKKELFVSNPLEIVKSDHSCSVTQYVNLNGLQNDLEGTHLNDRLTFISENNVPQNQFFKRFGKVYRFYSASNDDENVNFDPESLIEIFHKNNNSKSDSTKDETSSFCLWPVAANYIYVSNTRKGNHMKPVSSEFSSNVSDQLSENSLQPIYLNGRYLNGDDYDSLQEENKFGENTETFSSSLNDSLALFESDKQVTSTKNKKPILNATFNAFSRVQNTNFKSFNAGIQQLNDNFIQKTMAVQFAHCGDSFIVKNKHYTKENFKTLNGSSYTSNLNSFISIFTSNVGTDRQLNHRQLFRRAMNTLGRRPITRDNLFNNVQTLTSNSGPYRLFDLNGYPLTDSTGNVLRDPYGKCVVELDLTGFPKDDTKIYDAAGNTPKDVNFDPTQKPKTSTIILKLTDNLKRPLSLFDKYGRPLTDSHGKLLVNIYGRPLLRFDNFGQPNTDHRGGPLFTENGLRWSPKSNHSQEELSTGNKTIMKLKNKPCDDSLDSLKNVSSEKASLDLKNEDYEKENANGNDVKISTSINDIWSQLEIVLINRTKKIKVEPTPSRANIIVNNVSVLRNPLEQDIMKSIIYLDNFGQKESSKININEILSNKMSNHYINDNNTEAKINEKTNGATFESVGKAVKTLLVDRPNHKLFPLKLNAKKITCSSCLLRDILAHKQEQEKSTEGINYECGDAGSLGGLPSASGDNINIIEEKNENNTCKKYQKHRNQRFFNFPNEVLKTNIKTYKQEINSPFYSITAENRKQFSTAFSQSQLNSNGTSKYSTDILTSGDSQMMMFDSSSAQTTSQLLKLEDHDDYLRGKHVMVDFPNIKEIKKANDDINNINYSRKYHGYPFGNIAKVDCQNNNRDVCTVKKELTASCVSKKRNRLYERKIAEIILKSLENDAIQQKDNEIKQFNKEMTENEGPIQSNEYSEKKLKQNYFHERRNKKKLSDSDIGLENINNLTENEQMTYDSPFRFNSDREENDDGDDIQVTYIRGQNSEVTPNISVHVSEKKSSENLHLFHKDIHRDQPQNNEQYEFQASTKDKTNLEFVPKISHQNHQLADKKSQIKNKNNEKKYIHKTEKVTPASKECNLVAFLGSPVRYVLNKLDLTKQKPNRINREPKNTNKQHPLNDYNQSVNYQYQNHKNDNIIVYYKREIPEKLKQKKIIDKEQVLAFRSKSCIKICNKNISRAMSYSGNEDNLQMKSKSTDVNPEKIEVRRVSSDISHFVERCNEKEVIKNQDRKKHFIINKLKLNEPFSYKNKIIHSNKNKKTVANHRIVIKQKPLPEKGNKVPGLHYHKVKNLFFSE